MTARVSTGHHPVPPGQHPLRDRRFRRLWAAGLLGELGQWLLQIALPLLTLTATGSALSTSLVAVLGLGSSVLVSPFVARLADRHPPALLMTGIALVQAVALPALLIPASTTTPAVTTWLVAAAATIEGSLAGSFEALRNSAIPALVTDEQLPAANASISLAANLGRLAGSPLGGLVLDLAAIPGTAVAGAAFFLAAAVTSRLAHLPATAEPAPVPGPSSSDTAAGAASPSPQPGEDRRVRRTATAVTALLGTAQGLFVVLFLLFVIDSLHGQNHDAGLLRGVQAIGGLAAGVLAGRLTRRLSTRTLLTTSLLVFGLLSAALWNTPLLTTSLWPYAVGFALTGAPAVWAQTALISTIQRHAPPVGLAAALGRNLAVSDGTQALGILIAGTLAAVLPLALLLNLQASLFLIAAAITYGGLTRSTAPNRPTPTTATASCSPPSCSRPAHDSPDGL